MKCAESFARNSKRAIGCRVRTRVYVCGVRLVIPEG